MANLIMVSGKIRRDPYVNTGSTTNGQWKMYAVELSGVISPRPKKGSNERPEKRYTNYRAVIFASTPGMISLYDDVFRVGNHIQVRGDDVDIIQQEANDGSGKIYIKLELVNAFLLDFCINDGNPNGSTGSGQGGQRPKQNGQQSPRAQQQPAQQANDGWGDGNPADDDDAPF